MLFQAFIDDFSPGHIDTGMVPRRVCLVVSYPKHTINMQSWSPIRIP